jgi:hypothetical protein
VTAGAVDVERAFECFRTAEKSLAGIVKFSGEGKGEGALVADDVSHEAECHHPRQICRIGSILGLRLQNRLIESIIIMRT